MPSRSARLLLLLILAVLPAGRGWAEAPPLDFDRSQFAPPPAVAEAVPEPPTPPEEALSLMFVGDCKLCGRTAQQIARYGPGYPFALVRSELRRADIAFANCEGAFTTATQTSPGKPPSLVTAGRAFVFKSDPALAGTVFAPAGLDIVQLANNHALDYCAAGLLDTCAALDEAGIAYVGAGSDFAAASAPVVITTRGMRIGYLADSVILPPGSMAGRARPGVAYLGRDYALQLARAVGELRESCDLVVVGIHWGIEGRTAPDKLQRAIGHAAVDAGADFVIGTHPHTVQGVEFYREGIIAYSLGNFVFTGASQRLAGCILQIEVDPADPSRRTASLLPCWINAGRPTPSGDPGLRRQLAQTMRATGSVLQDGAAGWLSIVPGT